MLRPSRGLAAQTVFGIVPCWNLQLQPPKQVLEANHLIKTWLKLLLRICITSAGITRSLMAISGRHSVAVLFFFA